MSRRAPIPAASWWKVAGDTFRVIAEYLAMAKRAALDEEPQP